MRLCNADYLGISQPSFSRAINQTINVLSESRPHIYSSSGFFWTISNYTGSEPTSWHSQHARCGRCYWRDHIKIIGPSTDEDEVWGSSLRGAMDQLEVTGGHWRSLEVTGWRRPSLPDVDLDPLSPSTTGRSYIITCRPKWLRALWLITISTHKCKYKI